MVLRVPSQRFIAEVMSRLGNEVAYVHPKGRRTIATACKTGGDLVIWSEFRSGVEVTAAEIRQGGLEVAEGAWSDTMEEPGEDDLAPFVIAVSYRSEEARPGLWMDADLHEISPSDALRRMYDEFRANGEIKEASFDEFVRVIQPNVLVVPPHQIESWVEENRR